MKQRHIFLIITILICIFSIALIILKGTPKDSANFDSIMQMGEGILHHVSKAGQMLTAISDQEEIKIGDKIHKKTIKAEIARNIEGTPLDIYVNEVGGRVAKNVKRKAISYKFHIISSDYPNAFAGPGGHVYVTMSFLKILKSESELAAILGHEIVHIDAKHAIGAIQHGIVTEKIAGADIDIAADIGYQLLLRPGYSEYQEDEADIGGVYLAYMAHYHPRAVINAFENANKAELLYYAKDRSITPIGDTLGALGGMVGRYFGTHPWTQERIDAINRYIADNKLMTDGRRFYIGQRNYLEKRSVAQKMYKEELKNEYVLVDDKLFTDLKGPVASELYTVYGKLYVGMRIKDAEKILPERLIKFRRDSQIAYKDIEVYKFETREIEKTTDILLEIENGRVSAIK